MQRRPDVRWLFALLGVLLLLVTACAAPPGAAATTAPNDVAFVIPSGTESALERGEAAFRFPDEIELIAGQSVTIRNDDHAMHYFFDIPVAPGQTIRKEFPRSGAFVYQGGLSCSISRTNTIKVRVD
jgi:hypothetical protein